TLTGTRDTWEAFRRLQRAGARCVVMKLGSRGCLFSEDGALRQGAAVSGKGLGLTGAGGAVVAPFLQAKLRGWPEREAAIVANAAGAVAASVVGAGEKLPRLRQIAVLLRNSRLKEPWEAVRRRVLERLRSLPYQ